MTPEEMERAIEFTLRQQAEFAAGMQQMRELQLEDHRRFSDAILALTGAFGRLAEAQERTESRIAELAEHAKETDSRLAELTERTRENLNELTERVNAFIAYVERYIQETRNGKNRN